MTRIVTIEHSLRGARDRDLTALHDKVQSQVDAQEREGYKLISVTPLTRSSQSEDNGRPYSDSYTCGILLVFDEQ
jgi:hypothetical protein